MASEVSGFGDLPDLVEAIAGFVAGFAVLDPVINRLAFDSPLFAAVIPGDDTEVA